MKYEAEIWYVGVTYDPAFDCHIQIRTNCNANMKCQSLGNNINYEAEI